MLAANLQHAVQSSPLCNMALLNVRSLTNQTFVLNNFILSSHFGFFLFIETWPKPGEQSHLWRSVSLAMIITVV